MADPLARVFRQGPFGAEPVSIATAAPATRFIFRGDAEAARLGGNAFGCALPTEACRAVETGARAALWLGPDEWLLLDLEASDAAALGALIEAETAPRPHSLVDVSHRQVGIEIAGSRVELVLSAGCPLDLSLAVTPVGFCTRTVLAKADVTLWRRGEDRVRLEVNRSIAPYVMAFLHQAEDRRI